MNIRKKLLSLLLAGVMMLSLCACTDKEEPVEPSPSPEVTDKTDPLEDFVVDTSVEDLCLATAGIPGDTTMLTINGEAISAKLFLYLLVDNIDYLNSNYGLIPNWGEDAELVEFIKNDTINAAAYYTLVAAKCKELGYELTEAQVADLEGMIAFSVMMIGGEEAFEDILRMAGTDRESFYTVQAAPYYYERLLETAFAAAPTEQEVAVFVEENDLLCAKHILLLTMDMTTRQPLDEATIAEKKAQAETLLAQLQASDDLAADFDALMHEHSEDSGLQGNPDGYVFTAGQMVTEFEDTTRSLEYGQISGIVESPYGYHIILRLDPNNEMIHTQYRTEKLSQQLQTWTTEADIVTSPELDALDPYLFVEKYAAYQEAFAAESEAAADAAAGEQTESETEPVTEPEG